MFDKSKSNFTILAIDTSCDETSAAITVNNQIKSNIIASQIKFHQKYGGVMPNVAKRMHQKFLPLVITQSLQKAKKNWAQINAIAVTIGPGLAPALEIGIKQAKQLAKKHQKPLIAVNHMEGHLLSSFAKNSKGQSAFGNIKPQFPLLGLLVSGGHTQLVLMKSFGQYQLLGETLDDAAGEAFDKVAKMLGLGYPGGPIISKLAQEGTPKYKLPVPMRNSKDFNFSFSGLKTACLYKIQKLKKTHPQLLQQHQFLTDFAASFEKTAVEALTVKFKKAIEKYKPKQTVLGGGVTNNLTLRKQASYIASQFGLKTFFPNDKKLLTDNAAMIGVCGWYQSQRKNFVKNIDSLDRQPNLNF